MLFCHEVFVSCARRNMQAVIPVRCSKKQIAVFGRASLNLDGCSKSQERTQHQEIRTQFQDVLANLIMHRKGRCFSGMTCSECSAHTHIRDVAWSFQGS